MSSKPFCEKSKEVLQYIDETKPVYVYRNLHKQCLSVRQDGIVKCHAENVVLMDCEFKVSLAGQKRVIGGNSNQYPTINTLIERDGATYTQTPLEGRAS